MKINRVEVGRKVMLNQPTFFKCNSVDDYRKQIRAGEYYTCVLKCNATIELDNEEYAEFAETLCTERECLLGLCTSPDEVAMVINAKTKESFYIYTRGCSNVKCVLFDRG